MLLFHLPPRKIHWQGEISDLVGPINTQIVITLDPPELFGVAEFLDSLRIFPTKDNGKQDLRFHGDLFRGMGRVSLKNPHKFKEFQFDGLFGGAPISIRGNTATIQCVLADIPNFIALIQCVIQELPPMFACATDAPVSINSITGATNGRAFSVVMEKMLGEHYSISDELHKNISQTLTDILPDASKRPVQIVAAMRYLSQTNLLQSVSKFPYHFISERMLNVCKAVECLTLECGSEVNDMRRMLEGWGIPKKYIDIFASIRYLRSQLDIAHIAYSPLSESAYHLVQEFLPVAETCTRSLIITAIHKYKEDPTTYKTRKIDQSDPTVIRKLANYKGISVHDAIDLRHAGDSSS